MGAVRLASTILTTLLATAALAAARPTAAAERSLELVVANENLALAGAALEPSLASMARRIEELTGWPKGSLRTKAFARPAEALAHIKKERSAFAILPVHELLEGRVPLKLEVLGRAVGPEGAQLAVTSVTRKPPPFEGIANAAGKRVATTDAHDPIWITMMFDGNLDARGLQFLETPTTDAAVQAVVDKKADLALVPEGPWVTTYERRTEPTGDLTWAFRSGTMPPSAVVAVGKHVSAADKQKLAASVDRICRDGGGAACGGVGIVYIEAGRAETYQAVIALYESVRAQLAKAAGRRR
jgi:hypothetical protein